MISYDQDGVTLWYVDAQGQRVSASPMQTERYMALLNTRQEQIQAEMDNVVAVSAYDSALLAFQTSIDAGRSVGFVPGKPLRKVVHDDGSISREAFVPGLGDPHYPTITPATGIKAVTGVPPDRLDVVIQLLTSLHVKVDKLGVH